MSVPERGDMAIPKGSHVLLLDEAVLGSRSDFHVVFDGTEGVIQGHQVVSRWLTFTEMKDMSHLKRGKLYRFKSWGQLFKEVERQNAIGRVDKEAVLMFIEQSTRVAYTYMVISGDQAGWLHAYPEHFEELTDAKAEEDGEGEAVPDQAGSGSHEASLQGWGQDC